MFTVYAFGSYFTTCLSERDAVRLVLRLRRKDRTMAWYEAS